MKIPYANLRWSTFHNFVPDLMFETVRTYVFAFIKTVNGEGKDTAFSKVVIQKALEEAQLLFDSLMQKYFG